MQGLALIAASAAIIVYAVGGTITLAEHWRGLGRPRGTAEWLGAAIIWLVWPLCVPNKSAPERDDG